MSKIRVAAGIALVMADIAICLALVPRVGGWFWAIWILAAPLGALGIALIVGSYRRAHAAEAQS